MPDQKTTRIYEAPNAEQIQNYALNVCKTIRKKQGQDYFYRQEFISEFHKFIERALQIQTKHLNHIQEQNDEHQK